MRVELELPAWAAQALERWAHRERRDLASQLEHELCSWAAQLAGEVAADRAALMASRRALALELSAAATGEEMGRGRRPEEVSVVRDGPVHRELLRLGLSHVVREEEGTARVHLEGLLSESGL